MKEFGFSDKLGPLRYESNQEEVFLGHSVSQQTNISDETAKIIDIEIKRLVVNGETSARKIISSNIKDLHIIAKGLLEYETLTSSDIDLLLKGKKLKRPHEDEDKDNLKEKNNKKKIKPKDVEKPIGSVPVTAKNIS